MILVCGENLIDLFAEYKDGRLVTTPVFGGSPYNVALGLARLGTRTRFLSGFSTDAFGVALAEFLEKDGVDLQYSPRLAEPTTLAVVARTEDGSAKYKFWGEGAADRSLQLAHLPQNLPAEIAALTFGSLSVGVEPSGSTYLALAEREKGKRVISYDPNLRASVVGDIGRFRARQERMIACANIVKASIEDIEGVYGKEADAAAIAEAWHQMGAALVVVTDGGKGAAAYHMSGHVLKVPARKVTVLDTVGAGDTFHAALLNHLETSGRLTPAAIAGLSGDDLGKLLNFASAAAAVTCTRRGADMPRPADVAAELAR